MKYNLRSTPNQIIYCQASNFLMVWLIRNHWSFALYSWRMVGWLVWNGSRWSFYCQAFALFTRTRWVNWLGTERVTHRIPVKIFLKVESWEYSWRGSFWMVHTSHSDRLGFAFKWPLLAWRGSFWMVHTSHSDRLGFAIKWPLLA